MFGEVQWNTVDSEVGTVTTSDSENSEVQYVEKSQNNVSEKEHIMYVV